jgi:hypothetical protein
MVDKLILMRKYATGEMSMFSASKKQDRERYAPMHEDQKKLVMMRIAKVLPEYAHCKWSYGRTGDSECYITIYNSEF